MHFKQYRESQGSPPTHEVIITHDERDREHPFILSRVALYERSGKKVILRTAKPKSRKPNGPEKSKTQAKPKPQTPRDKIRQAYDERSVVAKSSGASPANL